MRTLNIQNLNAWLVCQGPQAREVLSVKSGIGYYTLGRILKLERPPTKPEQLALIQATGLSESELFIADESIKQLA